MKIGLIPLDERPANHRYPRMIAAIAGCELITPPPELLSRQRQPAPADALIDWLEAQAGAADVWLIACEMLVYGGLIASRIGHEPADVLLARLRRLRALHESRPALPLLGFSLITRISRHDDATEEPDYWADYGSRLFRFSQLTDRLAQGDPVRAALAELQAQIPSEHLRDFLWRRARNYAVNQAALDLLADGVFETLVLSSDDTSAFGLASRDKRLLLGDVRARRLDDRLLAYPGADEVGSVLVARRINLQAGRAPSFWPIYILPGGEGITAPFEDAPVRVTVERQIVAAGAQVAASAEAADVLLYIHPPTDSEAEWVRDYPQSAPDDPRLPYLSAAAAQIAEALAAGRRVAVADVAYANGASQRWIDALRAALDPAALTAFAAWNTAGNSIGTAIAQACAALVGDPALNRRFTIHRLLEDWGYQTVVRHDLRVRLRAETGHAEPTPDRIDATCTEIESALAGLLTQIATDQRVSHVRLPWGRTFEVDFDLEAR
jgi:hypothetical protein